MIDWQAVFLGVIAVSVLVMAAIQVGALIYGARLAQRVNRLADQVEHEVKPIFVHLQTVGAEAARASALAAQQVERADQLFARVTERLDETAAIVQQAVVVPAREGMALMAGIKAALAALRGMRDTAFGRRPDDEESLFIG